VAYVFDSVTAIASALNLIQTNCDSLANVTFCDSHMNITGQALVPAIRQNTFQGLTGPVQFVDNDRLDLNFTVNQYRVDGTIVVVGSVNSSGNATMDNSLLIFKTTKNDTHSQQSMHGQHHKHDIGSDGGGEAGMRAQSQYTRPAVPGAPISKIVPQQILIKDPVGAVFMSFVFLGMLVTLAFHLYFFIYRKEKVVRKTSPVFNQLILFGIDLVLISQIFWVVPQSTTFCILKVWFICLGFGLIMGYPSILSSPFRVANDGHLGICWPRHGASTRSFAMSA
jgi:hypothetical protein